MLGLDDHMVPLDQRTGEKGFGLLTLVSVPTPYPKARTLGGADKAHGQSRPGLATFLLEGSLLARPCFLPLDTFFENHDTRKSWVLVGY